LGTDIFRYKRINLPKAGNFLCWMRTGLHSSCI